MEPRTQYAKTSDGGRLAYRLFGEDGDAVVLVPSLGRGGSDFAELAAARAKHGYMAAAFDPRGVGESAGPMDDLTMHDLAADVAAVVESLDRGAAHAVGHALGNRVVRCLAADRPDLVRTVTLLAAGGIVEPTAAIREALTRCFQLDLPDTERLDAVQAAFFAPGNDAAVWREGWWPGAAAMQGKANRATPVADWWEAGSAPLLVTQGSDDATAPAPNGYALKEQLGDRVELVDIADAGHALLPEQPFAIERAILAFLAQH